MELPASLARFQLPTVWWASTSKRPVSTMGATARANGNYVVNSPWWDDTGPPLGRTPGAANLGDGTSDHRPVSLLKAWWAVIMTTMLVRVHYL